MASVLIKTQMGNARRSVPLLHFGLRQLLCFVALICVLLAAIASTGGITALVVLLASVIVAMHIFATTIGIRLRSQTDEEQTHKLIDSIAESNASADQQSAKLAAIRTAPRSAWHAHGRTCLPWLPRLVLGTMVLAGLAGALLLNQTIGHRASPAGIIVGAGSFAVLGGWTSFLCGNFYSVFRQGFREALAEQKEGQRAAQHENASRTAR